MFAAARPVVIVLIVNRDELRIMQRLDPVPDLETAKQRATEEGWFPVPDECYQTTTESGEAVYLVTCTA